MLICNSSYIVLYSTIVITHDEMCQKGLFVFLKTPEVELDAKKQELQETLQAEQVCIKPLLIPSLLQVRFSLLRHRTPKQAVHKSKQSGRQELMDWEQLLGS